MRNKIVRRASEGYGLYGSGIDATVTPFGCCNFFDRCTDEILSLHYAGTLGFLDWIGMQVTEECKRTVEFMTFTRPQMSGPIASPGYLATPCADPYGIEMGTCKLSMEGYGLLGRRGPTREIGKPLRYCVTDPRRRLDGTPVTSEFEWDLRHAGDVLIDDVRRMIINGSFATPGQFDGLEAIVKTGYSCGGMIDSSIIDWNANGLDGGAGITINGNPVPATVSFIDVLLRVFRRIKQRINWSPTLRVAGLQEGDAILLCPEDAAGSILDQFTCWSVCPGKQYNETNLQTYEARAFRQTLNGGLYGAGKIYLDNYTLHIMPYDWGLIKGPTLADMYLLFGSVGSNRLLEGEFLDANRAAKEEGIQADTFFVRDGGRVLGTVMTYNLCRQLRLWMRMRIFCRAPWAQARFENMAVAPWDGWLSPDPLETSFYPTTSFDPAECIGGTWPVQET